MPGGQDCHALFMCEDREFTLDQAPEVSNFSTGIAACPVSRKEWSRDYYGVVNNSRN
jgi:hypothetical protein